MITRRRFLGQAGAVTAGLALPGCASLRSWIVPATDDRPDVLLLITDQHKWDVFSFLGHRSVRTPNLDRLATEGAFFDNHYCASPLCTPGRSAIATGKWPHTTHTEMNIGQPEEDPALGLPPDAVMTQSVLFAGGYTTMHQGKWHLGSVNRHPCYRRQERTEDYYRTYAAFLADWNNSHPVNVEPGQANLSGWPLYMVPACERAHLAWNVGGRPQPQDVSLIGRTALPAEVDKTVWLTDRCLEDLATPTTEPIMAVWSVDPPHAYWAVQDPWYSSVDPGTIQLPANRSRPDHVNAVNTPGCRLYDILGEEGVRELLRCYFAMVNRVDEMVGRILGSLEARGRLDETIIVFTSDHGDSNGAHGIVGKAADTMYEETTKAPLLIRYPQVVPAGRRVRTPVGAVDVMPTILDLCGFPVPEAVQGRSLRPLLEGSEDPGRPAFCEKTHSPTGRYRRMIRMGDWKCVTRMAPGRKPAFEVYNLAMDPGEEHNLADDPEHAGVREVLLAELAAWAVRTDDPWPR